MAGSAMTREEIIARARKLAASGNVEAAKRAMAMAQSMGPPAEDIQPNPDGTYGQPPEGFIRDPNTGAMTSQELQANRMRPGAFQAARVGSEEGVTWGGRDELTGGIAAASPFLPGTSQQRYAMGQLRARAELEAARRDHPVAAGLGEALGSVVTGGTVANAGRQVAGRAAPGAAQTAANLTGRNWFTRGVAGAGAGAASGGTYGFAAGEGGLEPRKEQALNAAGWGLGLGAGASVAGDGISSFLKARDGRRATQEMLDTTPSADELKARASARYKYARKTGRAATPDETKALAQGMRATLLKEGAIGPRNGLSGNAPRVEGNPKVSNLLQRAEDYLRQSMTPAQMRTVRKAAKRAARSADPEEALLGSRLIKQFDDWSEPMIPAVRGAKKLHAAGKRGEMMDEAAELARIRSGQFSGSGYENALRTEYRALARRIVKGDIKGLSPEQTAAINKVAGGGPVENFARGLGKAAPTNVVSAGMGGGMPFLVGNAIGGPAIGGAMGLGVLAGGAAARRGATKMQTRNADVAGALMRGGKVAERTPEQILAAQNKRTIIEQLLRYGMMPATQ